MGLLAGEWLPRGAGHPLPVRQTPEPAGLLRKRIDKARHCAGFVASGTGKFPRMLRNAETGGFSNDTGHAGPVDSATISAQ